MPGNWAGTFTNTPAGVILHGSRSGNPANDANKEFEGTVNYVRNGAAGLGWNATIGDYKLCLHMDMNQWGWNARAASQYYLAVELAQAVEAHDITDGQVAAVAEFFNLARVKWPALPTTFPTHAELEASGQTGQRDGKTDVFSNGSPRADELRARIMRALGFSQAPAASVSTNTAYSMEPDHAFSFQELYPLIQQYGAQYGYPPQIIAGMVQQESTWHNYRVHRDGTGHGLLGLDDNGLLGDFERWSGLAIGRGPSAAIIPVEPQLEFAAYQLKRFWDLYGGDPIISAQAWHAGGRNRESERGLRYAVLIRGHMRAIFGTDQV